MSSDADEAPDGRLRDVVATFDGPPAAVHWLVLLLGLALWVGAYAAVMELTGWADAAGAAGTEATAARRHAAAAATLLAGTYYGTAWRYAYGGPLLNFLVPIVAVAFMPDAVFALFQPTAADAMLSTAESVAGRRATNPRWVADVLTVWVPGGVGLFGPIVLAERLGGSDARRERFREGWPYD